MNIPSEVLKILRTELAKTEVPTLETAFTVEKIREWLIKSYTPHYVFRHGRGIGSWEENCPIALYLKTVFEGAKIAVSSEVVVINGEVSWLPSWVTELIIDFDYYLNNNQVLTARRFMECLDRVRNEDT